MKPIPFVLLFLSGCAGALDEMHWNERGLFYVAAAIVIAAIIRALAEILGLFFRR